MGSKAIPGARTPPPALRAGLMGLLSLDSSVGQRLGQRTSALFLKTGFSLPAEGSQPHLLGREREEEEGLVSLAGSSESLPRGTQESWDLTWLQRAGAGEP